MPDQPLFPQGIWGCFHHTLDCFHSISTSKRSQDQRRFCVPPAEVASKVYNLNHQDNPSVVWENWTLQSILGSSQAKRCFMRLHMTPLWSLSTEPTIQNRNLPGDPAALIQSLATFRGHIISQVSAHSFPLSLFFFPRKHIIGWGHRTNGPNSSVPLWPPLRSSLQSKLH